ncbi:PREDICTED: receptor-like serine/threonine-protein kinase SD1-8 [Camelina sativa]|uniref:Receptor-like serine/threonine-protein kinase SD1-8 n=1 Tax=Camelina sativa TaxID=90675 RepID=A0ABM0VJ25_CAMSA|nr:PREDICTED: receptor-like serine/threonine-protein kinase SD1-8 [Camelina sativa]
MRAPLCVTSVFFFLFCFLYELSSSKSVLYSRESLTVSSNQTLVSPGNVFELGLFKPNESISRWYLGIWYKEDPKRTSLWVANRVKPLTKPVGTLKFFNNTLFLFEQDNIPAVWKTNLTGGGVRSRMVAELFDNGNFVVKDSSDPEGYLWQSFDSPTDTLLPEMKFKIFDFFDSEDDPRQTLHSWSSPGDPSPTDMYSSFQIRKDLNIIAIFVGGNQMDTWNGYQFGDMPPVFELKEGWLVMKTLESSSSYSRLTIRTIRQGVLYELYSWNSEAKEWKMSWSIGEDSCYLKGLEKPCGSYSYCSKNDTSQQQCHCIRGFYPKLERLTWSHDCVRSTAIHCGGGEFVKLAKMKLPGTAPMVTSDSRLNLEKCKESCLVGCNCTAYALVENRKGERSCLNWKGELHDMRNYTTGGQDLYVRVAGLAANDHG